VNKGEEIEDDM